MIYANWQPRHSTLILFAVSLFAACASSGPLVKSPAVELRGVHIAELSFASQSLLLNFNIDNPNPFPLPITSVRYRVQIDDQNFVSGETAGNFSVPGGGSGKFDIKVEIDIMNSAAKLKKVLNNGGRESVEYAISGSFGLNIPYVPPVRFSNQGTLSFATN